MFITSYNTLIHLTFFKMKTITFLREILFRMSNFDEGFFLKNSKHLRIAQLRWNPFSLVAVSRRSFMTSSVE